MTSSPLPRIIAWAVACFLALPVLVMLPISLTPNRYLSLPKDGLSLRHYQSLIEDPDWLASIGDSLFVAVFAAALAVVLGTSFAVGVWRRGGLASRVLRPVMLAPMIVPPIVHSVAFYKGWAAIGLLDSYLGLILVHAMKGTPFVILTVSAALSNFDPRTEQAARSLGASAARTMAWVVLPQIRGGLLSGAVFAFFISWDEIIVALFITMRRVYTLPRRIWDGLEDNIDPAIAALGTVMIVVTVALMILQSMRKG
jgi:putative spermidine/putrescine transport system permease protein